MTTTKLLTADDLWNMPDHGGHHELVKGELRMMAPAGPEHGDRVMRLAWRLAQYVEEHDLGTVFAAETGFRLSGDTVLAPDCAFVSKSRMAKTPKKPGFFRGAPDLAVEALSPGDSAEEVDEKIQEWLAGGVRLLWVINPKAKTISVYRAGGARLTVLKAGETLSGEKVVPGFQCEVAVVVGP